MAQLVAENVLAFDAPFWLRLAARADLCTSDDDRVSSLFNFLLLFRPIPS